MVFFVLVGVVVLAGLLLLLSYFKASGHAGGAVAGIDATLRRVSVAFVRFRVPKSGAIKLGWEFGYGPPESTRADVTAFAGLGGRVLRIDRGRPRERVIAR
jgi:hypothetical protein